MNTFIFRLAFEQDMEIRREVEKMSKTRNETFAPVCQSKTQKSIITWLIGWSRRRNATACEC